MQSPQQALRRERLLLAADGVAMFGTWIDLLAILTLAAYRYAVSPYQMALLSAAGILPGIVLASWLGRWCDRGNPRTALLASIGLRIATTAAVMLCGSFAVLLLLAGLRSLLAALVAPAVNVIAVRVVEATRRPRFYSLLNVLGSSAKVTAPALGSVASSLAGESWALGVSIALALVSLLLFAAIDVPARATGSAPLPAGTSATPKTLLEPVFGLLFATGAAYAWFVFMVNNLMPLVLQRSGFDKALLGVLIGCSGAGNIVSGLWLARRATSHRLHGRLGEMLWPAAGSAAGFLTIGLVLLQAQRPAPALAAIFFVGGLFSARFAIASNVYLTSHHAGSIGHASSLLQAGQNAMILLAPLAGAAVLDRYGPAALFLASATSAALLLGAIRLVATLRNEPGHPAAASTGPSA